MADLFASGRLLDFIFALVFVEIVVVAMHWNRTGKGVPLRDLLPNAAAGALLLLALRMQVAGYGWQVVCGCLASAGVAHMIDIGRRWKS